MFLSRRLVRLIEHTTGADHHKNWGTSRLSPEFLNGHDSAFILKNEKANRKPSEHFAEKS